jgi:transposase
VTSAAAHLSAEEIARHTGVAENTVHALVSRCKRFGDQAIDVPRLSKRGRCYVSKEEEVIFLSPFSEEAKRGEIATAAEIGRALEELLGHGIHHSTVYRLLERTGPAPFPCRLSIPQSYEVKANRY